MDISALTSASSRLLDALEKLGASKGAELRSPDGPGAQPPQELVRAFEEALAGQSPETNPETLQLSAVDDVKSVSGETRYEFQSPDALAPDGIAPDNVNRAGIPDSPTLHVHDVHRTDYGVHGVEETEQPGLRATRSELDEHVHVSGANQNNVQELVRILEQIGNGQLSAAELYRLQYLVGMFNVQAQSGSQAAQQTSQGIESVLKQQG